MPINQINPPVIQETLHKVVVKVCKVEGYENDVIIVENVDKIPTKIVVYLLEYAAAQLDSFPEDISF